MRLPKPRKIITEKYIAGLSLFKSKKSSIKLSANESSLGISPIVKKLFNNKVLIIIPAKKTNIANWINKINNNIN